MFLGMTEDGLSFKGPRAWRCDQGAVHIQQGLGGTAMPLEKEAERVNSASREGYWLCAI